MGNRNLVLVLTTLTSFITPFIGAAINIALPVIGRELNFSVVGLGWVATSYLLSAASLMLPMGKLADRNGRKYFFVTGSVIFFLSSVLSAVAYTPWLLIASRLLNGVGGAFVFSTSVPLLTSAFPKEQRGRVLGINVASVYLGLTLGPSLGGFIMTALGWRYIFWFTALLSFIIFILANLFLINDRRERPPHPYDIKGALVFIFSIAAITYGFPTITETIGKFSVTLGILGLVLFARLQLSAEDPLLNLRAIRSNNAFIFSNLAAFINYAVTFAVVFTLSIYLQEVRNFSPMITAVILMSQPAMMTLLSPVSGRLSDRLEPRILTSLGMGLTTLGLIMLLPLNGSTGIPYLLATQAVLGIGFGLFSSPNTNAVMSSVTQKDYGIASATLGTMRLTGQTISMGISMMIFAIVLGSARLQDAADGQILASNRYAYIVFAVLSVLGIYFSLIRGNIRN